MQRLVKQSSINVLKCCVYSLEDMLLQCKMFARRELTASNAECEIWWRV
jgi:hypothetical protein